MCQRLVLYQTVLSDTREIRSFKPPLDRGEARALSFSKECSSLGLQTTLPDTGEGYLYHIFLNYYCFVVRITARI